MSEFNFKVEKPAKPVDNRSMQEKINEAKRTLESLKRKICRDCKQLRVLVQSGRCEECQRALMEKREKDRQTKKHISQANGSILVYDENDKLVYEHRLVMEKHLGRKLQKDEVVFHLDGNKQNNDLANLALGFRHGIPLTQLQCTHCGTIGEITFLQSPEPDEQLPQD